MDFTTNWIWECKVHDFLLCRATLEVSVKAKNAGHWEICELGFEQLHETTKKPVFIRIEKSEPIYAVIKRDLEGDDRFRLRVNNELIGI